MHDILDGSGHTDIKLNIKFEFDDIIYASTDGKEIYISNHESFNGYETNGDRYLGQIGCLFHECGHIIYSDFEKMIPIVSSLKCLEFLTPEEINELSLSFKKGYWIKFYSTNNIIEDMYVDDRLKKEYSGQIIEALDVVSNFWSKKGKSTEEMKTLIKEDKAPMLRAFNYILRNYCLPHGLNENTKWEGEMKRAKASFDKARPIIDKLKYYQEPSVKGELLTCIAKEMYALALEDNVFCNDETPNN